MKKIAMLVILIFLSGCANMTKGQKTTAWVIGGIVVTSIILSSKSDDPKVEDKNCPINFPNDSGINTPCP